MNMRLSQTIGMIIFVLTALTSCTQDNTNMKDLVVKWNDANSSKDIEILSEMYDDSVLYYTVNKSKNNCIQDKLEFYNKHPDFLQEIVGEIETKKTNKNEYKCNFQKRVKYNNKSEVFDSYINFKKINNKWRIITEGDLTTDKNVMASTAMKKNELKKVFVKEKNIYAVRSNDEQIQLTFNNSDENPIKYNNESVLFIRAVKEQGTYRPFTRKKLMLVSVDDLTERVITEKKPFKDGNDQSNEIFNINSLTLSLDRESLYFTVEKWMTANELVKVNIENGRWTELFSAEYFEIIKSGKHKGHFLISRSEIRDKGRDGYFMLVNEKGKVLKDFGDSEEQMIAFKNIIQ